MSLKNVSCSRTQYGTRAKSNLQPLDFESDTLLLATALPKAYLSRLVGKPTMWFPNRSDTNQAVQSLKRARSLKFWF